VRGWTGFIWLRIKSSGETSSSIKGDEFPEQVNDCQLSNYSTPWGYVVKRSHSGDQHIRANGKIKVKWT
jgi:hypothetical protein